MTDMETPALNTDREIWRERKGDFYADSIHVTKDGGIGIDCGGNVIVMPIRDWHALAWNRRSSPSQVAPQPQAGEPVAIWISELDLQFIREGRFREAKVFNYEDEHRVPLYASPQPANPAQVGGSNLAERAKAVRGDLEAHNFDDVIALLDDYAAAIGAGGQAVAMTVIDPDEWEPCSPSYLSRGGSCSAPRVWNEAEGNHWHPKHQSALSQPHPADERVVEAPRIADPNNLDPIHTRLLTRGAKSKWIWLSDDAGTHTGEVCALGELRRAGLVKYTEDKLPPGPPSMRPMEITEAGRAALSAREGR